METKPKKFPSERAAATAVEEIATDAGLHCFVKGCGRSFLIQRCVYGNGFRITYDLHTDGKFHEYSRKQEVAA